jgi:hypothetical protein
MAQPPVSELNIDGDDGLQITSHRRRDTISSMGVNSTQLEGVYNKGPLLTTAMALFGGGSFLAARIANPSAYQGTKVVTNYTSRKSLPVNAGACAGFAPMGRLFGTYRSREYREEYSEDRWCLRNEDGGGSDISSLALSEYMGAWILHFNASSDDGLHELSNTFNTAAFLANQAFVMHNSDVGSFRKLSVGQNIGEDVVVPRISLAGLIFVSALLGAHLLGLLLLAMYATFSSRWADKLDAFAMMRIGAAMAQTKPLPLAVGREMDKIEILDEYPGRVGGSAGYIQEGIVQLELDGLHPLNRESFYASYPGDSDLPQRDAAMRQRKKNDEFRAMEARRMAAMAKPAQERV